MRKSVIARNITRNLSLFDRPTAHAMHSLVPFITVFTLLTTSSAVAISAANIGRPPIAYFPVPDGLQINSNEPVILPNVTIVNTADLLTPGTIVPGSLGPRTSKTEKRDVIGGVDNRFLQTRTGNPWDYIGRISWQFRNPEGVVNTARCSAALVGPRHLATAGHCRVNGGAISGTLVSSITFEPNYDQGPRGYTPAQVTNIIAPSPAKDWGCGAGGDWAVFILNQRLGDRYGHFGVKVDPSKTGSFWHEGSSVFYFLHSSNTLETLQLTSERRIPVGFRRKPAAICAGTDQEGYYLDT